MCADDGTMSADRTHACSTLPAAVEDEWQRSEGRWSWPAAVAATVVYGGLVAAAAYERNGRRGLPTTAGVVGGALAGPAAVACVGKALHYPDDEVGALVETYGALGALAGGVLGGLAAHALANSPGSRAAVTAVGLAPLYVFTLAVTFD